MRKKIIAGNWKMNADKSEALALVKGILSNYQAFNLTENKLVVVASPFPYIHYCSSEFAKYPHIFAGAQNCSEFEEGAFTGEVSAKIIASLDVRYVIIGHSERRLYFHETNEIILRKIQQAQKQNLIPIFCVGESLDAREQHLHFEVIKSQLDSCIFNLEESEFMNITIAYEPVWAIGTGKTASVDHAREMHQFIREQISLKYNKAIADNISILYGGSLNARNAGELFSCQDIDGGLVGGASLNAGEFTEIIKAMK